MSPSEEETIQGYLGDRAGDLFETVEKRINSMKRIYHRRMSGPFSPEFLARVCWEVINEHPELVEPDTEPDAPIVRVEHEGKVKVGYYLGSGRGTTHRIRLEGDDKEFRLIDIQHIIDEIPETVEQ